MVAHKLISLTRPPVLAGRAGGIEVVAGAAREALSMVDHTDSRGYLESPL